MRFSVEWLLLAVLLPDPELWAEEIPYDLVLAAKAGAYRVRGNLFADGDVRGWGTSVRLVPTSFGHPGANDTGSWLGGFGLAFSADFDSLTGQARSEVRFPFEPDRDIRLVWSVLLVDACALTRFTAQLCFGLPLSDVLYLEQSLGGQTWNAFSLGNSNLPVFLSISSHWARLHYGVQVSSSYWKPTFAGVGTHFNFIRTQASMGYAF